MTEQKVSFDDAMRAIRAWYYTEIREWAETLEKEIASGEYKDREDFIDRLHESIDGCGLVIYTAQAQAVILASDNSDAFVEEFGPTDVTKDNSVNWPALAYAAVERDLLETIPLNLNVDATFSPNGGEDE